ncbi:putative non-specific serine/threonine protein kinase [Lupinus albus]|uniref:Putative non-specific serine/threonine protein kinase n=1 Tax=Lupinus albus TaxID=3870 RepID=A0A6A4R0A0_LUPAL|nr:putative non-specific serine/threonine protein kinase [Lupinus albus]
MLYFICFFTSLVSPLMEMSLTRYMHDGRIDYNEFVDMMQSGNANMGKRGRKRSSSFSVRFSEPQLVC